MAREAFRSLYGDLAKLKDTSLLDDPAGGTGYDDALFRLLLAVSEAVDRYCNRHFYPLTATRLFDGTGTAQLVVPDLLAVTSLTGDDDADKTFEVAWGVDDYWLYPANAEPADHWGVPYSRIQARSKGTQKEFKRGEQNYRVAGRWGYREFSERSGAALEMEGGMRAGFIRLMVDREGGFAVGQTLLVDGEQMLVTDVSGNELTVSRGLNGTAVMDHGNGAAVFILRWPLPVERATLINTARVWTRAPSFEPFYVDAGLDTDVRWLLEPFRLAQA